MKNDGFIKSKVSLMGDTNRDTVKVFRDANDKKKVKSVYLTGVQIPVYVKAWKSHENDPDVPHATLVASGTITKEEICRVLQKNDKFRGIDPKEMKVHQNSVTGTEITGEVEATSVRELWIEIEYNNENIYEKGGSNTHPNETLQLSGSKNTQELKT
ncbi:hypothetical protein DdX_18852 [Ditylenchus destructor]|uniref:Uncharacterized protein n=1 Tax=Ditylenchus destructor TaxID=166010 RepID=A0AAD4MLI6_9BILA|nr:hypothetical protein DdX_18852 [Ditylenchus destructor]